MFTFHLFLDFISGVFASPVGLMLFFGATVLQILMLWSTEESLLRWLLLILSGVIALFCAALFIWGKKWSVAFLATAMFPYAVVIFSGVLAGTLLYKLRTAVHTS